MAKETRLQYLDRILKECGHAEFAFCDDELLELHERGVSIRFIREKKNVEHIAPTVGEAIDADMEATGAIPKRSPEQIETRRRLQDIAHATDERLPEGYGFFTMIFPFGDNPLNRANYVSNAERTDVLKVMKEFLIRAGAGEDWMKHIE